MSIEDNITEMVNSLDHIADQLNPSNDFGSTVGDELNGIHFNLSRIADALEKIVKQMK